MGSPVIHNPIWKDKIEKKNQLTKWAKKMTGENLSKLARPVT
jgi:hypothetical protein